MLSCVQVAKKFLMSIWKGGGKNTTWMITWVINIIAIYVVRKLYRILPNLKKNVGSILRSFYKGDQIIDLKT